MTYSSTYDEKALLFQISLGDEQAFHQVFSHWSPRVYHFALGLTSSPELAEDIVQDVFLRIWLRRDRLTEVTHFSSYLFQMARNNFVSGLRRKAIENKVLTTRRAGHEGEVDIEEQLSMKLVNKVLQEAIQQLPAQQRKVWQLRRQEGLKIREVAEEMGISEVTVKRHLGQAQHTLRTVLESEFPFEAGVLIILIGL